MGCPNRVAEELQDLGLSHGLPESNSRVLDSA